MDAWLGEHAGEFDVAHLHACRNLPGVLAARHLHRAGVPFVLQPNGTAPRLERRFLAKRVFDLTIGRHVMPRAAAIVAVSEAERRQLVALGISPSRIKIVGNPVEIESNPSTRRAAEGRGETTVLFLGKITPRKNVDLLIRAFAHVEHPDARLVIAGNDMGAGAEARALVDTLGLTDRVTFAGLLAGDARLVALREATVVVYPSADEIFGLVPLEGLLQGTPVIVADDSGCGEIVSSVGGGLVVPVGDVSQLTRAIDGVIASRSRWQTQVDSAAARVRERFSPESIVNALDDVYSDVLGQPADISSTGVSFVVPVRNGAAWIRSTLNAIWSEGEGRAFEVILVDDGSEDGTADIATRIANGRPLRVIAGPGRGAAAALNVGFRAARFPFVAQVDQDVTIRRGWLTRLLSALDDTRVGAAQGRYVIDRSASISARVMAIDLEQRYDALGSATDHVCTGNTVYRAEAVHAAGLFDEQLGYGYDNDLSYRLRAGGHTLSFIREATSIHHWRNSFLMYLRQQYGFGYGRLDVVAKHPTRVAGDDVSGTTMMLHPIGLGVSVVLFAVALLLAFTGGPYHFVNIAGAAIAGGLVLERAAAGIFAWRRFGERSALLFPVWHLARDAAWVSAIGVWLTRRAFARNTEPAHSMRARPARPVRQSGESRITIAPEPPAPTRILGVIPAHNERATIASVLGEIHTHHPAFDLLVVDDGSTDGSSWLLDELHAPYLRLPERMGVGTAMRAGLSYAARLGYDTVVRLDGDGQHRPEDIDRVLAPLLRREADVVTGSRYPAAAHDTSIGVRLVQRVLAASLSAATGSKVSDPTSGFCAIGPRAIRLLADHHPTGYPEPELRLFLSRNGLTSIEVPVQSRPRLAGRSTLTYFRLAGAAARVLLALVTVPFRRTVVAPPDHD
jgi:hypothetical protein